MNDEQNKRTGDFIRSLRESLKQSQQEFADMLFVERSTVSKWENGSSFPKNESLLLICEKFDLTIDELLAGERSNTKNKSIRNNIILSIINKERKTKKLNKYIISLLFIVTFSFLVYYFFTTYNSIHVYLVYGSSDSYKINDGLIIMSNEKVYFKTGKILNDDNEYVKINKIELYSLENDIKKVLFVGEPNELLVQKSDNIELFKNFKNKDFFNNIYLTIKSDNIEETIKMDVKKDFNNRALFFNSKDTNSKNYNQDYYKINKNFTYNEEDNTYTLTEKDLVITYYPNIESINVSYIVNTKKTNYYYSFISKTLKYRVYKDNQIETTKTIYYESLSEENEPIFNDFTNNYLNKYFSETNM